MITIPLLAVLSFLTLGYAVGVLLQERRTLPLAPWERVGLWALLGGAVAASVVMLGPQVLALAGVGR